MSIEDLRNAGHALAKDIHELDVDRHAAELAFADRLEKLSTRANDLAVALQNYTPDQPPAVKPSKVRFALHKYDNRTPTLMNSFQVYDLQRGYTASSQPMKDAEVYLYTTIVRRPSDSAGLTQFLKPHLVLDAWCAHTPDGKLVTRIRNEGPEQLINIAAAQWRAQAIPNIVDEVVKYGATGLYVDEVDAWWKYAWTGIAGTGAKEFRTEAYWRSMWLTLLRELAAALHTRARKLWVNLGADYNITDSWQSSIVDVVDGVNIEFYTGREGVGDPPTTVTDGWATQNAFLAAAEQSGTAVHVHSSSLDQKVTDYAFTSWLLHTEFLGSFSASRDYGGTFASPDGPLWLKAQSLGAPAGKRTTNTNGTYSREFKGGRVTVNPTTRAINTLPATSGLIELR